MGRPRRMLANTHTQPPRDYASLFVKEGSKPTDCKWARWPDGMERKVPQVLVGGSGATDGKKRKA
eukprot:5439554-Pyramimonas_sp.AAC.1